MSMPTFPAFQQSSMETKRRRFVPMTLPDMPSYSNNDIANYTFESPLLQQAPFCGKVPTPQEIEAQLLQVGMRVRKSVNDGYKKVFNPRPFFRIDRLSASTQAALAGQDSAGGLHNVGGMGMQPTSTATFCGINLAALGHVSTAPVIEEQRMWSYSTSHKRGYEAESSDESDGDGMPLTPTLGADQTLAIPVDYFNIAFEEMSDVSPFSQPQEVLQPQVNGRRMAKPRARKAAPATTIPEETAWNPFANMAAPQQQQLSGTQWRGHKRITSCGVEANMMMGMHDFGEASFLQRREDIDMDCS